LNKKILYVDDEANYRKLVKRFLEIEGYDVLTACDGEEALNIACHEPNLSLIILDVMMPVLDGWETCREIRKISQVPILMLTALDDVNDEVFGIENGADDYIAKPFANKLFIARVNALIRRDARNKIGKLQTEDFEMDETIYSVTFGDELIRLTPKEYVLFEFLIVNKNFVLSRDKILNGVWGFDYYGDPRTVDTHIKSLRSKLKTLAPRIVTVRNRGYCYRGDSE